MFWLVSVCPHLGGTPTRSRHGGLPQPGPARGDPDGGYPTLDTPLVRPGWGVPWLGGYHTLSTPPSDLAGGGTPMGGIPPWVSPFGPGWGYPNGRGTLRGVPHLEYPPSDLAGGVPRQGGTPPRVPPFIGPGWEGGYPTSVVLDTPRSVCFLRSRRKTFLFYSSNWMITEIIYGNKWSE